jgi:hypothetical protein
MGSSATAPKREPAIAEGAKAVLGLEVAAQRHAVRRAHRHAGEVRRPRAIHRLERAHLAQDARRLRTEILRARLGAREVRTVEHEHARARPREKERGRRTRGAAAHDDHVHGARAHGHSKRVQYTRSAAIAAPAKVAIRFTRSLSTSVIPPAWRVAVPHPWISRSVLCWHVSHHRLS